MHAHARKVNPRDGYARGRRLVRRSTVYGPTLARGADGRPERDEKGELTAKNRELSAQGVGLMFFCCQANIEDQFEAVQSLWANDLHGGADTVIGQVPAGEQNLIGLNGSGVQLPYQSVVRLIEGEYFFAPSIRFFSNL
jgi:deferrochelatase/peroxidase EfeB